MFRLPYLLGLQVAPTATALEQAIGQPGRLHHAKHVWLPSTNCGIATYPNRAMDMAGLSPARLRPCRPLHQTPVVSCALAKAHPGLLPSSHCKPSASHHVTLFGAPSRGLSSRYTRLRTAPCGEARGFPTNLLARL